MKNEDVMNNLSKEELLKGLSIEELQERNEFSAAADPGTDPLKCTICQC